MFTHAHAIDQSGGTKAANGRIAKRDILGNRQRWNEAQFLGNSHDTRRDCLTRAGEGSELSGNENAAAIGPVDTTEDTNQRRFSSTVLADNGMDLAGPDVRS